MLAAGQLAPDFQLRTPTGEPVELDHGLKLAIFFKTNCPTCQYAWPFYERLYQAYAPAGLAVWGISQHNADKTSAFERKYRSTFPLLIDDGFVVSREFDPDFVPTGFLIDRNKNIIATTVSWNREELDRLSKQIASQLQVPRREIFRRGENVIPFRPG